MVSQCILNFEITAICAATANQADYGISNLSDSRHQTKS